MDFPKQNEKLFTSDKIDWKLNACIDCYLPSLERHADFFKDSADALAVAAADAKVSLDKAIIPIVFLYRHYIELSLKHFISTVRQIEGESHDFPQHHKLNDLWAELKQRLDQHYDQNAPPELANIQPYIDEFMTHDPYATAFRYPVDKAGNPSLSIPHINLRNLFESMERLSNLFSCMSSDLDTKLDWINEQRAEYRNG